MSKFSMSSIVVSLALCGGAAAMAAEADVEQPRSRAEVIAERDAALAAGTIATFTGEDSGDQYLSRQPWLPSRSRAEVVAEVMGALRSGLLAVMFGEDSGSGYLDHLPAQPATRFVGPTPAHDDESTVRLAQVGSHAKG